MGFVVLAISLLAFVPLAVGWVVIDRAVKPEPAARPQYYSRVDLNLQIIGFCTNDQ